MAGKLRGQAQIRTLCRNLRRRGKRIVFTNGCFDLIHPGHIQVLTSARALGDRLIVGLNSDRSVRKLKGRGRPLISQQHRARMLEAFECVSYVVLFNSLTPEGLIRAIRPHVLVKGADWTRGQIVGEGFVKSYGGVIRRIPLAKGFSTTRLVRLLSGRKRTKS